MFVRDSLVEAGWDEPTLDPIIQRFTGEATGFPGGFGGGGGGGGDPEAFEERPGERFGGGGGGFDFGTMREVAEIIAPGVDLRSVFRFGGGGGGAPLVEPGSYTVTLTVGDRTFTRPLVVDRVGAMSGENSPFETDAERR